MVGDLLNTASDVTYYLSKSTTLDVLLTHQVVVSGLQVRILIGPLGTRTQRVWVEF